MKWLIEFVDFVFMIEDNSTTGTRRWRIVVSLIIVALGFHVVWACNFIPGLDGFARAGAVDRYRDEVTTMHVEILEQALLETRTRQCTAIASDNAEARYYSTQKLQELYGLYRQLAEKDYRVPDCKEVR